VDVWDPPAIIVCPRGYTYRRPLFTMDGVWEARASQLSAHGREKPADHCKACEAAVAQEGSASAAAGAYLSLIPTPILKRSLVDTCVFLSRKQSPGKPRSGRSPELPSPPPPSSGRADTLRACLGACSASPEAARVLAAYLDQNAPLPSSA
jgi:hypothetical protein